jgi:2-polyprenyl-3-methyl-5-hydroxy-6-metoxy-1,4-benzoquinol methylase
MLAAASNESPHGRSKVQLRTVTPVRHFAVAQRANGPERNVGGSYSYAVAPMSTPDEGILPLTGERTVPGVPAENYWFRRHEAAYAFAAPLVAGGSVVEVGCGEGYGAALLAPSARRVIGIDYDALTVRHARAAYPELQFVRANLAALPLSTGSLDVVTTLQVIEHVWDHGQFVRECLRVLRPDGLLLVTTPNRLTFSPGLDKPVNPFHTREFTAAELSALLTRNGFAISTVLGLHAGERVRAMDARYGSFVEAQLAQSPEAWTEGLRADVANVELSDFPVLPAGVADVDVALDLVVLARPA